MTELTIDGLDNLGNVGDVISFPEQSKLPEWARDRLYKITRIDETRGTISLLEYTPPGIHIPKGRPLNAI